MESTQRGRPRYTHGENVSGTFYGLVVEDYSRFAGCIRPRCLDKFRSLREAKRRAMEAARELGVEVVIERWTDASDKCVKRGERFVWSWMECN